MRFADVRNLQVPGMGQMVLVIQDFAPRAWHFQGAYETALAHSQAVEALNRKGDRVHWVAGNLHEQGLIYNEMARASGAEENVAEGWFTLEGVN